MDMGACKARLVSKVPEIAARDIAGAAEFAEVVDKGNLPTAAIFAYLMPSGLRGLKPNAMAGLFSQPIAEELSIAIGFRTHSVTAEDALDEIRATIYAVMDAFCGWVPDPAAPGLFQFVSGGLAGFQRGAVIYQLKFSTTDEVRVTP